MHATSIHENNRQRYQQLRLTFLGFALGRKSLRTWLVKPSFPGQV